MQETFGRVASKVGDLLMGYAKQQGFTLVLDGSQDPQQTPLVLYVSPNTDITKTIVDAYNTKSGVPAPPPQAPSAPMPNRPATKTPPSN